MILLAHFFVGFVALQHFAFGILEMFLWTSPLGRKVFRTDAEFAKKSKNLAANQGLYNYFLAAGLLFSFFLPLESAFFFQRFFLTCVVVAGAYGAATVSIRILLLQALPAAIGLFLHFLAY